MNSSQIDAKALHSCYVAPLVTVLEGPCRVRKGRFKASGSQFQAQAGLSKGRKGPCESKADEELVKVN